MNGSQNGGEKCRRQEARDVTRAKNARYSRSQLQARCFEPAPVSGKLRMPTSHAEVGCHSRRRCAVGIQKIRILPRATGSIPRHDAQHTHSNRDDTCRSVKNAKHKDVGLRRPHLGPHREPGRQLRRSGGVGAYSLSKNRIHAPDQSAGHYGEFEESRQRTCLSCENDPARPPPRVLCFVFMDGLHLDTA